MYLTNMRIKNVYVRIMNMIKMYCKHSVTLMALNVKLKSNPPIHIGIISGIIIDTYYLYNVHACINKKQEYL